jgi:hypothetical protein
MHQHFMKYPVCNIVRFEVLTVVTTKITLFRDATPCSLKDVNRRIGGMCFHLQCRIAGWKESVLLVRSKPLFQHGMEKRKTSAGTRTPSLSSPLPVTIPIEISLIPRLYKQKTNSVTLVCKRTIPTERPPLVGEVSAKLCE